MALWLYRLGRFSFRNKWWFIGAWLIALIVMIALVAGLKPAFKSTFALPGTDSDRAMTMLAENFPAVEEDQFKATTSILVAADDGIAAHTEQIDKLVAAARQLPNVIDPENTVVNPLTVAAANPALADAVVGDGGKVGLIEVKQDTEIGDLTTADMEQFTELLAEYRTAGLDVEGTGALMQVFEMGGSAELIALVFAFIVMIVAFGALIAAFIPIITAVVGVGISLLLAILSAKFFDTQQTVITIVSMLGLAVAIDYALFIVSRYRSELNLGGSREAAAGRAVGTAGSAVVFAGLTVVIAVAGLAIVGIPFITQMGLTAAIAVIIAVLGAITFIPALLGAFGGKTFTPRIPGIRHGDEPDSAPSNGLRFVRFATRYPIPVALIGLLILAVAALPIQSMRLGMETTTDGEYAATQLLKRGFGEGVNGPLLVVVSTDDDAPIADAANDAVEKIAALDNVANATTLMWQGNGTTPPLGQDGATAALISVIPTQSASSEATHTLMTEMRDYAQTTPSGVSVNVGGQTAIISDISDKLSDALIPFLVIVVGLAFIILMVVFRSILVPLVATLGFLFSVGATFGATVWIFQQGHLGIVDHTKPIISFLPIFLVGVVFGLAMDYQVFLVTRMREEYVHGVNAKDSVIIGYQHGARVVASAAVIMIVVFMSFMLVPDTTAKMMGFALAAAVFFDAFIIRMVVVPAVIALLGDAAWKLPRWLDKIVPNVDVEGTAIRDIPIEGVDPDAGERVPAPAH